MPNRSLLRQNSLVQGTIEVKNLKLGEIIWGRGFEFGQRQRDATAKLECLQAC